MIHGRKRNGRQCTRGNLRNFLQLLSFEMFRICFVVKNQRKQIENAKKIRNMVEKPTKIRNERQNFEKISKKRNYFENTPGKICPPIGF